MGFPSCEFNVKSGAGVPTAGDLSPPRRFALMTASSAAAATITPIAIHIGFFLMVVPRLKIPKTCAIRPVERCGKSVERVQQTGMLQYQSWTGLLLHDGFFRCRRRGAWAGRKPFRFRAARAPVRGRKRDAPKSGIGLRKLHSNFRKPARAEI